MVKGIFAGFAAIVCFLLLIFATQYTSLSFKGFFKTWDRNIEREVFENTKSHVHGTIQSLTRYKLAYQTASKEAHKTALRETILMEYSSFKHKDQLPRELQNFIEKIR